MEFMRKSKGPGKGGDLMRKGFWNGLVTGGILGVIATMFMAPQFKKARKDMIQDTKMAGRARRVIKGVRNMAEDWMK